MKWDDIAQEVINGTVTAAVWVAIIWIANRIRNHRAEKKLRDTLSQMGVHHENEMFGVTVKNDTEYEITVRDVTLLTNDKEQAFVLLFSEKGYDYMFQEKPFTDPRKLTHHQRSAQRPPQPLLEKSADLGPFTRGTWKAHVSLFLDHPDLTPSKCHLAIQYRTLLGNPKVLVVDSNERCSNFIQESFQKQMVQLRRQQ